MLAANSTMATKQIAAAATTNPGIVVIASIIADIAPASTLDIIKINSAFIKRHIAKHNLVVAAMAPTKVENTEATFVADHYLA